MPEKLPQGFASPVQGGGVGPPPSRQRPRGGPAARRLDAGTSRHAGGSRAGG